MYLSRLHLENWRCYGDATFEFKRPSNRRPIVLIGAMNGHGKTSFLLSLYLGIFGKFGLRYCEGFRSAGDKDLDSYRKAINKFRRNNADPDHPTTVEITFSPTLNDAEGEEFHIRRTWFFSSSNTLRQYDFEEVEIRTGDKPRKWDLENAPAKIESALFPAHVAPAFFFDGEQAQALIENAGEEGIKKAVEVMFGSKILSETAERVRTFISASQTELGGKKKLSEQEADLQEKVGQKTALMSKISGIEGQLEADRSEKDQLERDRSLKREELARLGGAATADILKAQRDLDAASNAKVEAEKEVSATVKELGLALAMSRLELPLRNRIRAEELLEVWENLKKGTIEKQESVMVAAMPEPPEKDNLLGLLSQDVRQKVKERFLRALEIIYNPAPDGCAEDYLLGHARGEARRLLQNRLDRAVAYGSGHVKALARRLRDARDAYEEAKSKTDHLAGLPQETEGVNEDLKRLDKQIDEAIRRVNQQENELKKLKAELHDVSAEIGRLRELLKQLVPEQRRIAVAESVNKVLTDLLDELRPTTLARLEALVTKHFIKIADRRYRNGKIVLGTGGEARIVYPDGSAESLLATMSGFERRSFGIAFSLALAEITQRRLPLVIDTPLGNADSDHRPRTLKALVDEDLADQVIILTHDREVTEDLVADIHTNICQRFLVRFDQTGRHSQVMPNEFFF